MYIKYNVNSDIYLSLQRTTNVYSGVLQGRSVGELVDPYLVALFESVSYFAPCPGGIQ